MKNKFGFTKTIRFKLTLLYSSIFFLFSVMLVLILNVYLSTRLTNRPPDILYPPGGQGNIVIINNIGQSEINHIQSVRLEDLNEFRIISLLGLAPIALLSFFLGYVISGRFLKPLTDLTSEFKVLETKDLGKTIPVPVEDEVGRLIESFNSLSLRLNDSFLSQEQFIQDASHELKTPLTVIQTNLDTVVEDPRATKEDLLEGINNALEGMRHLRKLTTDLLVLNEPEEFVNSEMILNNVIANQVALLKEYAQSKGVTVDLDLPKQQVKFKGNDIAMGRAIYNIIENGIKYSSISKNPLVQIALRSNKGNIVISISNNGPLISDSEKDNIFKRFYRIDKSRHSEEGSFGLGLPISQRIINNHKGKLTVENEGKFTSFIITLPVKH